MVGWHAAKKAVAVSGAGSGIGRALCGALARAGARSVLCLDRDLPSAEATARAGTRTAPQCAERLQSCIFIT